jgi:hypothetical protein
LNYVLERHCIATFAHVGVFTNVSVDVGQKTNNGEEFSQ